MEHPNQGFAVHTLAERVAILEIQISKLEKMEEKLDQLLQLKAQGMGALSFVTILVGSGALGIVATLLAWFKGRHG